MTGGGDEDVKHLRRADAVDDPDAASLVHRVPRRLRQRLARGDARAKRREVGRRQVEQHGAVRGGSGGEDGDPMAVDRLQELCRGRLLEQVGRRARAQWKDQALAESEGEGERRARGEEVVLGRLEDVLRERVRDGEHVAVKVHGRFRLARGAGREGEHAHVVRGGGYVLEQSRFPGRHLGQVVLAVTPVGEDLEPVGGGGVQVLDEPVVADRHPHARDLDHGLELALPEQRHRGHGDAAGLDHAEPARDEPWVVRAAEQDPVAGHEPHLVDERLRDLVGPGPQVGIGPLLGIRQDAAPRAGPIHDVAVQQLGCAVEHRRVLQLREVEQELGPL